jgi:hypothetical protein
VLWGCMNDVGPGRSGGTSRSYMSGFKSVAWIYTRLNGVRCRLEAIQENILY